MKEFKGEQPYAAPGLVTPAAATATTRTSLPWCCSIPVKGEQVKLAPGLVTPTSGSQNCDHRSIPENKIKKLSAKKEASRLVVTLSVPTPSRAMEAQWWQETAAPW